MVAAMACDNVKCTSCGRQVKRCQTRNGKCLNCTQNGK